MSLITEIKAMQVTARKAYDAKKALTLTTLIGEAEMVGKNAGREVTDAEVLATIKKFIKNIDSTLEVIKGVPDKANVVEDCQAERDLLESFMPKQLDEQGLTTAVQTIVDGHVSAFSVKPSMGAVMGFLKATYEGRYDGKMASTVVKAVLA